MARQKLANLEKSLEVSSIYEYICDSAINGQWRQVDDLVERARKCEGYNSNDFANVLEDYVSDGMRKSILNRIL